MKFELWLLGKNEPYIRDGMALFAGRINRYVSYEERVFTEVGKSKAVQAVKDAESKLILSKLDAKDYLVILDERGKAYASEKFAALINNLLVSGKKKVVFLIGGAYGFDDAVRQRANAVVSLSEMTFSHQIVRVLFAEQLYRAFTIINNEPYHHA
jgi:23S rRNA (pseudouridine1915-N3)-methyltransferase